MRFNPAAIACAIVLAGTTGALAQTKAAPKPVPKSTKPAARSRSAKKAASQAAAKPAPQVVMPDAEKIVLLLRTTLSTLNDALQTGNFTVLRDMAAPGFRDANTAARLAQSFSDLASKRVDLSPTSIIAPQLTQPPGLDKQKGMLHLKGYFPGQPVQINFEMLYQAVDGRWRLFGLSVQHGTGNPAAGKRERARDRRREAAIAKEPWGARRQDRSQASLDGSGRTAC